MHVVDFPTYGHPALHTCPRPLDHGPASAPTDDAPRPPSPKPFVAHRRAAAALFATQAVHRLRQVVRPQTTQPTLETPPAAAGAPAGAGSGTVRALQRSSDGKIQVNLELLILSVCVLLNSTLFLPNFRIF